MPEAYKVPGNPVQAYRNFYVGEKWRFATWTRRRRPKWFTEAIRSKVQKPRAGDASRERMTRTVTRAALATRTSIASTSASEARGCESKREAPCKYDFYISPEVLKYITFEHWKERL